MPPVAVIDTAVVVDALVGVGGRADDARAELAGRTELAVPAIFAAEAVSALQGLVDRGQLGGPLAAAARSQLARLRTGEYPFGPFSDRVWELRESVTVYDAWWVALAESLQTDLVTADRRLIAATGPRCRVWLPRH